MQMIRYYISGLPPSVRTVLEFAAGVAVLGTCLLTVIGWAHILAF